MLRIILPRIYVIMLRRIENILCRITELSYVVMLRRIVVLRRIYSTKLRYVVMLRRIVILRRICSKVCDVE